MAPDSPHRPATTSGRQPETRRVTIYGWSATAGVLVKGTPKSEASKRKITLPELIMPELRPHLNTYPAAGPDGFVFVGVKGGQLRRSNFSKPRAQALAKSRVGELLNRMGHSATRAARIYLHTRQEREQQLAAALDRMVRRELKASDAKRHRGPIGHANRNPASRG